MLEEIKELKQKLGQVLENKDILDLAKPVDDLQIALSNGNLLVNDLISFYEQDKSAYFPKCITEQITSYVGDANAQLNSLLAKDTAQSEQLRQNLDKLYALCLQCGITTFGFSSKEMHRLLDETKRNIQNLQGKTGKLGDELQKKTGEVQSLVQTWQNQLEEFLQTEQKKITEKSSSTVTVIDKESQDFKTVAEQNRQILTTNIEISNKLKEEINQVQKVATEKKDGIEQLLNTGKQLLEEIKKTQQESFSFKNTIDVESKNAHNLTAQIQTKLDDANQIVSQISAKNNTADDNIAKIQEKKKTVDEFYTTVETYKQEMLDTGKKAKADYSELKQTCEQKVAEYSTKTDEIVQQNTVYQEAIKELLAKAVSGGLFKVFNQRQEVLSRGTRFWKWAVVVSSMLVAVAILVVAYICEAKPDVIFFVRLAIMIPLAFLMFFAATQYKKERQAEEEYAFKSAISLSLEPYRDLLVRMRKEDQTEADFVKKLMEEVFDNPVMRMFDIEEEEEKICKTIMGYLKKLPSDKATSIIETITKKIAEQK